MGDWLFIRHGATAGNLAKRYVGRTDEPLCESGRAALAAHVYPSADLVYVSPLRRCVETAALLYPTRAPLPVPDFRETDFGAFEGKNHRELNGDPDYQAWIDAGGLSTFPDGENPLAFRDRCAAAFAGLCARHRADDRTIACVVHGGTIMAILERFGRPARSFYDWQTANGNGYAATLNADGTLTVTGGLW